MPTPLPPGTPTSASASPSPRTLGPTRLGHLVGAFTARRELWLPHVRFESPDRYCTRLEHADTHEVWLLTWLPGQGTDIHGHGGSHGAFTVVRGELDEQVFTPPADDPDQPAPPGPAHRRPPAPRRLRTGSVRAFGPAHVHQVVNQGTAPAVSIHAYSPPLSTMSYYRPLPDGRLVTDRIEGVDA